MHILSYFEKLTKFKEDFSMGKIMKEKSIAIYGNIDETPIQYDMPSGKTYDFVGKKEVAILVTKGIKMP